MPFLDKVIRAKHPKLAKEYDRLMRIAAVDEDMNTRQRARLDAYDVARKMGWSEK